MRVGDCVVRRGELCTVIAIDRPVSASDLWYYRFLVKSADLSRFQPFSDFLGRSVPKHSAPNQKEGRLGRHPPVWGDAKL